eukprot:11859037-Alexandrium_andersonii.AAC.1
MLVSWAAPVSSVPRGTSRPHSAPVQTVQQLPKAAPAGTPQVTAPHPACTIFLQTLACVHTHVRCRLGPAVEPCATTLSPPLP